MCCVYACVRTNFAYVCRYATVVKTMKSGPTMPVDLFVLRRWALCVTHTPRPKASLPMIESVQMCLLTFGEYVKCVTNEMNVQHHKIQSKYCLSHICIEVLNDALTMLMLMALLHPGLIRHYDGFIYYTYKCVFPWISQFQSKNMLSMLQIIFCRR